MSENKEVEWRDIPSYKGYYQASSEGHIRSVTRYVRRSRGGKQILRGRVLSEYFNKTSGYFTVAVSKNGKPLTKAVHRLVSFAFHGKTKLVTDHKNTIRTDNRPSNLRHVTQRENTSGFNKTPGSLGFVGLSLNSEKYKKRYRARIRVNGKLVDLGSYHTPEEASIAYQTKRNQLC